MLGAESREQPASAAASTWATEPHRHSPPDVSFVDPHFWNTPFPSLHFHASWWLDPGEGSQALPTPTAGSFCIERPGSWSLSPYLGIFLSPTEEFIRACTITHTHASLGLPGLQQESLKACSQVHKNAFRLATQASG